MTKLYQVKCYLVDVKGLSWEDDNLEAWNWDDVEEFMTKEDWKECCEWLGVEKNYFDDVI